jgi:hypothetical protein
VKKSFSKAKRCKMRSVRRTSGTVGNYSQVPCASHTATGYCKVLILVPLPVGT